MSAQSGATISSPASGLVFHQTSRAILPIIGVPGSAYLGTAVANNIDAAWCSPGGRYILAVSEGRTVLLAVEQQGVETRVDGRFLQNITNTVWSADGGTAVAYSRESGQWQRIRFTGESMEVHTPVQSAYLGTVSAMAVSRSGAVAFAIDGQGIYFSSPNEGSSLLASVQNTTDMVLSPDGGTLFVLNARAGAVLEIAVNEGRVTRLPIGADQDALGLTLSENGSIVYIASGQRIQAYDVASDQLSEIPLDRRPSTMQNLRSGLVLLNGVENDKSPAIVLDTRQQTPAVFFIPVQDVNSL